MRCFYSDFSQTSNTCCRVSQVIFRLDSLRPSDLFSKPPSLPNLTPKPLSPHHTSISPTRNLYLPSQPTQSNRILHSPKHKNGHMLFLHIHISHQQPRLDVVMFRDHIMIIIYHISREQLRHAIVAIQLFEFAAVRGGNP